MLYKKTSANQHFEDKAYKILINRCPHCDIGMEIDTPLFRICKKCGYSDSSNIPLKVKLSFEIRRDPKYPREVTVLALEPDKKWSFYKDFVDVTTATIYLEAMKTICLP